MIQLDKYIIYPKTYWGIKFTYTMYIAFKLIRFQLLTLQANLQIKIANISTFKREI